MCFDYTHFINHLYIHKLYLLHLHLLKSQI